MQEKDRSSQENENKEKCTLCGLLHESSELEEINSNLYCPECIDPLDFLNKLNQFHSDKQNDISFLIQRSTNEIFSTPHDLKNPQSVDPSKYGLSAELFINYCKRLSRNKEEIRSNAFWSDLIFYEISLEL